jgi:hypothetical protein
MSQFQPHRIECLGIKRFPSQNPFDGFMKQTQRIPLIHKTIHIQPTQFMNRIGLAMGRHDDNSGLWEFIPKLPGHIQPVLPRHFDVQQHQVRPGSQT